MLSIYEQRFDVTNNFENFYVGRLMRWRAGKICPTALAAPLSFHLKSFYVLPYMPMHSTLLTTVATALPLASAAPPAQPTPPYTGLQTKSKNI